MAVTVADIQRLAEAKMAESARTYIALGAGQEQTLEDNTRAFQSCLSSVALEDVMAKAPKCPIWQQVYLFSERCLTENLVKRAAAQGCKVIVVTADAPVDGDKVSRHEYPHGLPNGISTANLDAAFSYHRPGCTATGEHSREVSAMLSATFKEIEWLRSLADLPIVVKGVLRGKKTSDEKMLVAMPPRDFRNKHHNIDVLTEIVAAMGDKMEVYLDSGVRTGADVVKALALGARAVFVGWPVLCGLAYDGKQGVQKVLRILRDELEHTMRLLG
nr:hydroxyacid oxidase 1-like [Rhipicephalus microplus]